MPGTRAEIERSAGEFPPADRRAARRFSTRRRLIVAFSAVIVASIVSLVIQLLGLRRMEATFVAMEDHERQESLALQLEEAVRLQFSLQARVLDGGSVRLAEYEEARSRVLSLADAVAAADPDGARLMSEVRNASAELHLIFRQVAVPLGEQDAILARARSYPLVYAMEENVHRVFASLQQETSSFREELELLERRQRTWAAIMLLGTPLFGAAAVLYLSRSVARPLAMLSDGAAAVAAGNLDARIGLATNDEFGALGAEFDRMTAALKQHQQRLVESEKLAGIGRLAAGVAHELNNPLQVMLGYLSLNRDIPDKRLRKQLAAVEDEGWRCKAIVDGLLELSRPTSNVGATRVELRPLCEDVVSSFDALKRGDCSVRVDGEGAAFADRHKVRQIVFNLVKNAIEAAPEGNVEIVVAQSTDWAEVSVSDDGPGVGVEARHRIFEPFFTTKPAGTGLGLAVSRAIARANGGDVETVNGASGGAVFTLRLPAARGEVA